MAIPAALFARAAALGIARYLVKKWGPKKAARRIAKQENKIRDQSSKKRTDYSKARRMTTKKGGKGGVPTGLGITRKKP